MNCSSCRSETTDPICVRNSSSNARPASASMRFPAVVSSIRDDRRSSGLAFRRQYPAASTQSTSLLTPPTVIASSFAMSNTRHVPRRAITCIGSNQVS